MMPLDTNILDVNVPTCGNVELDSDTVTSRSSHRLVKAATVRSTWLKRRIHEKSVPSRS